MLWQQLRVDDCLCIRKTGSEIVMVGNDHVHAARAGVVYGLVSGDARVAGEQELRAVVEDRLESLDVNAVTLLAAYRDVVNDVRAECLKRLYQHCGGGLPVHVEVAPDADNFLFADGVVDALDGRLDIWERSEGNRIGMEEGAGRLRRVDAAADESLRDERREAQVRERGGDFDRRWFDPASHFHDYNGCQNVGSSRLLLVKSCAGDGARSDWLDSPPPAP